MGTILAVTTLLPLHLFYGHGYGSGTIICAILFGGHSHISSSVLMSILSWNYYSYYFLDTGGGNSRKVALLCRLRLQALLWGQFADNYVAGITSSGLRTKGCLEVINKVGVVRIIKGTLRVERTPESFAVACAAMFPWLSLLNGCYPGSPGVYYNLLLP